MRFCALFFLALAVVVMPASADPLVYGFQFEMTTPGVHFTQVEFPYGPAFGDLTLAYDGTTVHFYHASGAPGGDIYTFLAPVSLFSVTGISPPVDGAISNSFPVWINFDSTAASFTMTPLTAQPVPEPAGAALLFGVLVLISGLVRHKTRSTML